MDEQLYSLEAEAATLGSMMLEPGCIDWLEGYLAKEDFFVPEHKVIFDALAGLYRFKGTLDLVMLRGWMTHWDTLKKAGGVKYLAEVADSVPTSANHKYYAEVVKDWSRKRNILTELAKVGPEAKTEDMQAIINDLADAGDTSDNEVSSLKDHLEEAYSTMYGDVHRLNTGFERIDRIITGLEAGDIAIIAARPSIGKTSLAISMAVNMIKAGNPVLFFSFEMTKAQIAERIICFESQISAHAAKSGYLTEPQKKEMLDAMSKIHREDWPIRLTDYGVNSPSYIRSKIIQSQKEHGIKCVFIDYLQMMYKGTKEQSRNYELGWIIDYLKTTAKKCMIPIVVLCQLNRASEGRDDKKPRISELRDSGEIEQAADVVMLLHRPGYYDSDAGDISTVLVAKHRRGPTGLAEILFQPDTASFVSLGLVCSVLSSLSGEY